MVGLVMIAYMMRTNVVLPGSDLSDDILLADQHCLKWPASYDNGPSFQWRWEGQHDNWSSLKCCKQRWKSISRNNTGYARMWYDDPIGGNCGGGCLLKQTSSFQRFGFEDRVHEHGIRPHRMMCHIESVTNPKIRPVNSPYMATCVLGLSDL